MPGAPFRTLLLLLLAAGCARPLPSPSPQPPTPPAGEPAAPSPAETPSVAAPPVPVPAHPTGPAGLPAVPFVSGRLALDVVYPLAGTVVAAQDSTFLFGSVGHGSASLRINGTPVRVWPNGAWLAWVPIPPGSPIRFRLEAALGTDTVRAEHLVTGPPRFRPPPRGPWIDTLSFQPRGDLWWPRDEPLPLSVRAAEGAQVALLLPGGRRLPLWPLATHPEVASGIRAFDRDTGNLAAPARADRFHGALGALAVGTDPGPMLPGMPRGPGAAPLMVEAVIGRDTVRSRWPLRLGILDSVPPPVELNDDWQRTGGTDLLTPGRARPGATYHWFFPAGTVLAATARYDGDLRVRLAPGHEAWVAVADARALGSGGGLAPATVGSITVTPSPGGVELRIPVTRQVPFAVDEEDRRLRVTLYHAAGDLNWIRYGGADPLLAGIRWRQSGPNVELTVDLAEAVWGYRTRWDRGDLLLRVRRPPTVDRDRPFAGRTIAVDAGHPPGGSTGPTRLLEADANLAVAIRLRDLLAAAGARVVMTRTDSGPVDLWPRVRRADEADADLLVSIHNNALPDGVNPFTNHGASVFYFHPRSLPLARAVQEALVETTGLRDLGVARGDLALARPTGMPAILVEGMFMIVPEQEAALRSPEGQERYARAVFEGLRRFLLWHSARVQTSPR